MDILPTKEQLEAYIADGVSQVKIGEIHGLGRNKVRRLERALGLGGTREHGRVKPTGGEIKALQTNGLTLAEIAVVHNIPLSTIKSRSLAWERRQRQKRKKQTRSGPVIIEFLADDHPLVRFMARPFEMVMNDLVKFGKQRRIMNTQKHLEEMVHQSKKLTARLERQLASGDPLHTSVEAFVNDIIWTGANYNLGLLVRRLTRDERRTIVNQEIDTVGPGATVVGTKIDRIG